MTLEGDNDYLASKPLRTAIDAQDKQRILAVLKNGDDVHAYNDYAICQAVQKDRSDIVSLLLDYGAGEGESGNRALMMAVNYGRAGIIRLLLGHKRSRADVHHGNELALRTAVEKRYLTVVKTLLEAGADAKPILADSANAAFVYGQGFAVDDTIYSLLYRYAAETEQNSHWPPPAQKPAPTAAVVRPTQEQLNQALRDAVDSGSRERIRIALEAGADVQAFDNYALNYAAENDRIELLRLLLDHGAAKNGGATQALVVAATCGRISVVRALLEYPNSGIDIQADNNLVLRRASGGWTNSNIIGYLLKAGADPAAVLNDKKAFNYMIRYREHHFSCLVEHWLARIDKPGTDFAETEAKRLLAQIEEGGWSTSQLSRATELINQLLEKLKAGHSAHVAPAALAQAAGQQQTQEYEARLGAERAKQDEKAPLMATYQHFESRSFYRYYYGSPSSKNDLLCDAVNSGSKQSVLRHLGPGVNIRAYDDYAVRKAVHGDYTEILRLLLDHYGEDPAGANIALMDAAFMGRLQIVRLLLERKVDVGADNSLALYLAAKKGHTKIVRLLLEAGADPARIFANNDLAYKALTSDPFEGASLLLRGYFKEERWRGRPDSDITAAANWLRGQFGDGASGVLYDLCQEITREASNLLSIREHRIAQMQTMVTDFPVYVRRFDLAAVEKSLAAGADIHMDDEYPLRHAAREGERPLVELLLKHNANVNAGVAANKPVLCDAVAGGCREVVELLLNSGADIHAAHDRALFTALEAGDIEMAAFLLAKGGDLHANGSQPLLELLAQKKPCRGFFKLIFAEAQNPKAVEATLADLTARISAAGAGWDPERMAPILKNIARVGEAFLEKRHKECAKKDILDDIQYRLWQQPRKKPEELASEIATLSKLAHVEQARKKPRASDKEKDNHLLRPLPTLEGPAAPLTPPTPLEKTRPVMRIAQPRSCRR